MNSIMLPGSILWILGLTIIIAGLGWEIWQTRFHLVYAGRSFTGILIDIGGFLFSLGIAIATDQSWPRILFSILAAAFIVLTIIDLRSTTREHY